MKTFEYNALSLAQYRNAGGFDAFLRDLRKRGGWGWELCGFEYGCAFLKRRLRTSNASPAPEPSVPEATKE